ncbi:MAG: S53 family peptidase [Ktedonobacteraceae bacterium]|nr:S53 family peptidase [Ktedonobacteraceae bacterium]
MKLFTVRHISPLLILCLLLIFFGPLGNYRSNTPMTDALDQSMAARTIPPPIATCPHLAYSTGLTTCYTPYQLRLAYGVESLLERGFSGKGQTVVDIVSFGSPTLQQDMDVFNKQFGLPPINVQVIAPLGTKAFDPHDTNMLGWAEETELDVQIIHAIAPDAGIVVLTSPVAEVEGTVGLPQFWQLEQYALAHHLGSIVSQSWGASELTLQDAAGQQEVQKWDAFYQQTTTKQGVTYLSASGDKGATDFMDMQGQKVASVPTTSFPADEPWVTSVGGTTLLREGNTTREVVWNGATGASGGGFSAFFPTPAYQQSLPTAVQSQLNHRRGVPDVAAVADPNSEMAIYVNGRWGLIGGTSASTPLWAGIVAIANQMAGHPLGFLNPALYKIAQSPAYAQDFHDITSGDNTNAETGVQGYPAVAGWDASTGLGSPNAEKLLPDLIKEMQP